MAPVLAGVTWFLGRQEAPGRAVVTVWMAAVLVSLLAPLAILIATSTALWYVFKGVAWDRRTSLAFCLGWLGLGMDFICVGSFLVGV